MSWGVQALFQYESDFKENFPCRSHDQHIFYLILRLWACFKKTSLLNVFDGPNIDFNSNNEMVLMDHSGLTWTLCHFFSPSIFSDMV